MIERLFVLMRIIRFLIFIPLDLERFLIILLLLFVLLVTTALLLVKRNRVFFQMFNLLQNHNLAGSLLINHVRWLPTIIICILFHILVLYDSEQIIFYFILKLIQYFCNLFVYMLQNKPIYDIIGYIIDKN